jgi:hypothetical protein
MWIRWSRTAHETPSIKLQQKGSVKYNSETFLQLIVKVDNVVNENNKLRRYVEGLKDEIRTVVREVIVDGRYTAFYKVKSAAEALDFELWRSRRKTTTTGTTTGWHATRSATGTASGSARIHGKAPHYSIPVNVIRNDNKFSKKDTERYRSKKLCFSCETSGYMARTCPRKGKDRREAHEENQSPRRPLCRMGVTSGVVTIVRSLRPAVRQVHDVMVSQWE